MVRSSDVVNKAKMILVFVVSVPVAMLVFLIWPPERWKKRKS
jgi:hypothetical protein